MRNLLFSVALLFLTSATAQQVETFGEYDIYYNVINSHLIPPEAATAYGIQRASTQALLNVTVMRTDTEPPTPVHARIRASATNLNAQRREIRMREFDDREAVYYIGQMRISNEETYDFDIEARPQGHEGEPFQFRFRHQFFVD